MFQTMRNSRTYDYGEGYYCHGNTASFFSVPLVLFLSVPPLGSWGSSALFLHFHNLGQQPSSLIVIVVIAPFGHKNIHFGNRQGKDAKFSLGKFYVGLDHMRSSSFVLRFFGFCRNFDRFVVSGSVCTGNL
jgi:hypothetical protein